jgi:sugar phosphate permease
MNEAKNNYLEGGLALRVFGCFAAAYLLSYCFRSINAVIAPALMNDLALSNSDLGLLSSAYFVTFSCLQLPLGIWLDRYGSRRTEAVLLLFAAVGAVIFATSTSLTGLWIGRSLIGVGVSACLMAPLTAFRRWYAPARQPQMASWMLFAGTTGALSSTVPVTMAMPHIGWRGVFLVMATLILIVAACIFFVMRPAEQQIPPEHASGKKSGGPGYREIFKDPYFQRLALLGCVCNGNFVAMQTLWLGPWLVNVQGLTTARSAQVLFLFNLALMAGYLGMAWWAPKMVARTPGARGFPVTKVLTIGMCGSLATQAAILLVNGESAWLLWILLALCAPTVTLAQTQISTTFPAAVVGRANSAYNMTIFVMAFFVQWGVGMVIDAFRSHGWTQSQAMHAALAVCLGIQALAVLKFAVHRSRSHSVAVSSEATPQRK